MNFVIILRICSDILCLNLVASHLLSEEDGPKTLWDMREKCGISCLLRGGYMKRKFTDRRVHKNFLVVGADVQILVGTRQGGSLEKFSEFLDISTNPNL